MENVKSALSSKTVWGGIMAMIAGILGGFGYNFGLEDQAGLANAAVGVVSGVGGAIAIVGRLVATKKIG